MKYKHCFRRVAAAMACLMLCAVCMPGAAHAAGNEKTGYHQLTAAEMARTCSVELHYTNSDSQPLPETEFRLYKVAEMNSNVQFTVTDEFSGYPVFTPTADGFVKINGLDADGWASLASTLANYVSQDSGTLTPAASVKTDAQGIGTLENVGIGLYLLLGERSTSGSTTYTPTPVLVALPFWNAINSTWEFEVSSNVKYTEYTPSPGSTTVQRRVLKVWDDEDHEEARPSEVVVDLLRNGEVYDTVTLNDGNNWRASWTGLNSGDQWQLTERVDSDDYVVSIEQEGVTFVVTNSYLEDFEDDDPPLAGDPNLPGGPDDPNTPDTPGGPNDPNNPNMPNDPDEPDIDINDPDIPQGDKELYDPDVEDPSGPDAEKPNGPDAGDPDDPEIEINDPDVPLDNSERLPQTGQLWWPVPILAICGAGMVLAGIVRRRNKT